MFKKGTSLNSNFFQVVKCYFCSSDTVKVLRSVCAKGAQDTERVTNQGLKLVFKVIM